MRWQRDRGQQKTLTRTIKLLPQKVVLSSVENKKQLICLIFEELTRDRFFHQESTQRHKLVVTREDPCPIEVSMEEKRSWFDLETQHEEADIIIIHQVLYCAEQACQIVVISDDTNVFVLLLHHYQMAGMQMPMTMESPSKERAIFDIKATLAKHQKVMQNLLPANAISGCDAVACYSGIEKDTVIKILKDDRYDLSAIRNVDAPLKKVTDQATCFVSACSSNNEASFH